MRIRFIGSGDPTENAVCEVFGLSFPVGQWVEVEGEAQSLALNPTFEADEDGNGVADVEELRAQLDALGIPYHHRAGVAKLQELLAAYVPPEQPEEAPEEPEAPIGDGS